MNMSRRCLFIVLTVSVFGLGLAGAALAALTVATYPVAELGGCRDARECFLYCDIPANTAACWYWDNFQRPRVLQATTTEQTVTIEGEALTLAEAADFCTPGSGHEEVCLAAAQGAGVDLGEQLPEGYTEAAVAALGGSAAPGADVYDLVSIMVRTYNSGDTATKETYQRVALERFPEEHLRQHAPRHAAFVRLQALAASRPGVPGLATALSRVADAEDFCAGQPDLCYEAAREAGMPVERLVRGVPPSFVRKFAADVGLPADATPQDLRQTWEALPAEVRASFIKEYAAREAATRLGEEEPPAFLRRLELTLEQHGDAETLGQYREARRFKEELRSLPEEERRGRIEQYRRRIEGEEDEFKQKIDQRLEQFGGREGFYKLYDSPDQRRDFWEEFWRSQQEGKDEKEFFEHPPQFKDTGERGDAGEPYPRPVVGDGSGLREELGARGRPQPGTAEYEAYRQQFTGEPREGGYPPPAGPAGRASEPKPEYRREEGAKPTHGEMYDRAAESGYPLPPREEVFKGDYQPPAGESGGSGQDSGSPPSGGEAGSYESGGESGGYSGGDGGGGDASGSPDGGGGDGGGYSDGGGGGMPPGGGY